MREITVLLPCSKEQATLTLDDNNEVERFTIGGLVYGGDDAIYGFADTAEPDHIASVIKSLLLNLEKEQA